jgi:hypothetical protein
MEAYRNFKGLPRLLQAKRVSLAWEFTPPSDLSATLQECTAVLEGRRYIPVSRNLINCPVTEKYELIGAGYLSGECGIHRDIRWSGVFLFDNAWFMRWREDGKIQSSGIGEEIIPM